MTQCYELLFDRANLVNKDARTNSLPICLELELEGAEFHENPLCRRSGDGEHVTNGAASDLRDG